MSSAEVKSNERWFRGLHFAVAVVGALLLFSLLSCVRAKEEPENLGPAVEAPQVKAVLDEVFDGNTYLSGKNDQYVYYEENISAQGGAPVDRGFDYVKLVERIEDPATPQVVKFKMHYIRKKLDDKGDFQTVESEEVYPVDNSPAAPPPSSTSVDRSLAAIGALGPQLKSLSQKSVVRAMGRDTPPTKITYHRLEVQRGDVVPVPEAVRARGDCGGLAKCRLNSIFIKLDEVKWYGEKDYDKMHYDLVYSKDTPFLINTQNESMGGLMVLGCLSTHVTVDGRKVYVRNCVSLKDFQK